MDRNTEQKNMIVVKWLPFLLYAVAASLANSVLNLLPLIPSALTTWISRGIMAVTAVAMIQLTSANARYQKAGIMRAVMLGISLLTALFNAFSILAVGSSVLSIIAAYQEYTAHSELIKQKDPKLSSHWQSLFAWSIAASLLIAFASVTVTVITALLGMNATRISTIVIGLLSIPQLVIDVIYLLYIKKMIGYFRQEEIDRSTEV
ncbi:MAG: hypothetical protein IJX37_07225 [Oscillospiraceae bacterium]|nr:hypothetical protein [Oscillospiraceae bacterium]